MNVTMAVNENYRSAGDEAGLWQPDSERIEHLCRTLKERGIRLVLVAIPERVEQDPEFAAFLQGFALEHGVLAVTEFPSLKGHSEEELLIPNDGHPTALKHSLIAQDLALAIPR